MNDRIMLKADAGESCVAIRTVSAKMKSPQRFLVCYDELDRLESEGRIIASDIHSFVKISVDRKRDRAVFDFTWLNGHCHGCVEGTEEYVVLRWSVFREFLDACRQPDGPKKFKAISLDTRGDRPKLVFVGDRRNLKAAIGDRRVRHKLGKALANNFIWPDAQETRFADDFVRFSFYFLEYRDGKPVMCGGLILHGQEDMSKAYYGLHT